MANFDLALGHPKAWVLFDGSGTLAIDDEHNVSSVTDNAIGDYSINFTETWSSADYVVLANGYYSADAIITTASLGSYGRIDFSTIPVKSTTVFRVIYRDMSVTPWPRDFDTISVAFLGQGA